MLLKDIIFTITINEPSGKQLQGHKTIINQLLKSADINISLSTTFALCLQCKQFYPVILPVLSH